VSPSSLIDSTLSVHYYNQTTVLGFTEQLYTASGSQSHCQSKHEYKADDNFDPSRSLSYLQITNFTDAKTYALKQRTAFTWNKFGAFHQLKKGINVIGHPAFAALADLSLDNLPVKQLFVQFKPEVSLTTQIQF